MFENLRVPVLPLLPPPLHPLHYAFGIQERARGDHLLGDLLCHLLPHLFGAVLM